MNGREHPCEFCDTELPQDERLVTLTLTYGGRWYIFKDVPAKVCPNCGHRYYDGPMLLRLERLMKEGRPSSARPVEAYTIAFADAQ